jgi:hypothetical protein
MPGRRLVRTVSLSIVIAARFATPGHAQSPSPAASPAAFACPSPSTSSGLVLQINVVPNGNSCGFDPRIVPDLKTYVGSDGYWLFCSTCPFATRIELEATDGPFGNFISFTPLPEGDNLVKVSMPSNGFGNATGHHAKTKKDSKYNLVLRPSVGGTFLDRIDPRLEIDDNTIKEEGVHPDNTRILLILAALIIGFLLGRYFTGRTRSSQ